MHRQVSTVWQLFATHRATRGGPVAEATQREWNGEKISVLYSNSVEMNKALPDNLFELPEGVKS